MIRERKLSVINRKIVKDNIVSGIKAEYIKVRVEDRNQGLTVHGLKCKKLKVQGLKCNFWKCRDSFVKEPKSGVLNCSFPDHVPCTRCLC